MGSRMANKVKRSRRPKRVRGVRTATQFVVRQLTAMPRGQAIVIIAMAMMGLLAAVGLAVDGAIVVTQRADLRRATDAAALAGVVELEPPGTLGDADAKAQAAMSGNGVIVNNTTDSPQACAGTDQCMIGSVPASEQLGAYRYRVETSKPVNLTFMSLLGISTARVQAEATAEYFPQADLFASTTQESGVIKTSSQSIFGPRGCTDHGDPYTPFRDYGREEAFNNWWDLLQGTYHYRIRVPRNFVDNYDTVRVEILDPDGYNRSDEIETVTHELPPLPAAPLQENIDTDDVCGARRDTCVFATDAGSLSGGFDPNNDFWFHRMDEIRGNTNPGQCGNPASNYWPGEANYETSIRFELFYYAVQADGSVLRNDIAQYTSPVSTDNGGGAYNTPDPHCTDLQWVSPGAAQANRGDDSGTAADGYYDYANCPAGVQTTGNAAQRAALEPELDNGVVDFGDFEIDLGTVDYSARTCTGGDIPNCSMDPITDDIFIYLNVTGVNGSSETGYEFWAGPDLDETIGGMLNDDIPTDVNERNVLISRERADGNQIHSSEGVVISGLGHLPMNSHTNNPVDIPIMYVGPELAGQEIRISLFDPDSGSDGPITFTFEGIPSADWSFVTIDDIPAPNGTWTSDYVFTVPSQDTDGVVFVGGRLVANYNAGGQDTYGWYIRVDSRPYLIE